MKPIAIVALAVLALATPGVAQPLQPAAHSWQPISIHAPELRPMLSVALEAIPHRAPLMGVFRAERQFLGQRQAYRLILVLADQSKWRVTLVPADGGAMHPTEVEPVP